MAIVACGDGEVVLVYYGRADKREHSSAGNWDKHQACAAGGPSFAFSINYRVAVLVDSHFSMIEEK